MAIMESDIITVRRLDAFAQALAARTDIRYLQASGLEIKKLDTAEDGYISSYQLVNGTTVLGATINIPKDYVITAASVQICQTADDPIQGLVPGDKYIDLTINVKEGTATANHLYLAVKDLVDPYTAGNGINISAQNEISVVVDPANANGLSVGAAGLALALAQASAEGVGGSAGAMSAADKEKLDNLENAYTGTDPIVVNDGVISIKAAMAPDSDAGVAGNAGSMSADDKAKLDSIVEATTAEITTIVDSLWTTSGS